MTTWILLRSAGIGAYLMLFLSVSWGLISTTAVVSKRVSKRSANLFHQFTANAGLLLLAIHMALLLIDEFMPFAIADLLIPMRSTYRPVATGLGVVGMYLMVVILVTSWLRKPIGPAWWRRLHLLSVPAFTVALAHGIFAGSDSGRPWAMAMYAITGILVLFLVIVRGLTHGYRPPRGERPSRNVSAPPAHEGAPDPAMTAQAPNVAVSP
ncbi:MAG TPA: ferric reductase-like transmembrane domain-containing protein [Actinomycetota bacterium]